MPSIRSCSSRARIGAALVAAAVGAATWVYIAGTNAKYIAEAASHEAGHNLGLRHDGVIDGPGYYDGHGDWAPIMGVGYYEAISQWSRGEYSGASNTEDDFVVVTQDGGPLAIDDHGGPPPRPRRRSTRSSTSSARSARPATSTPSPSPPRAVRSACPLHPSRSAPTSIWGSSC